MEPPPTATPSRAIRALVLLATLVLGALWVVVTHPLEGPVVWEISENHGIHRYDFLGLIPPLVALWWMSTD